MQELSTRQVDINDPFWTERLKVNSNRAIFHQWEQLESSGCIDNFRIAIGEKESLREGWFFADSDAYKWLEAASRIHAAHPDPSLVLLMDRLISLLERVQDEDGYLFTYNQIHFPGTRWVNLMIEHELYCHGHLIEAGVSHFHATGQERMLNIARKAADRVTADFLGKGPFYTPGHEEVEIALLRLYQLTNFEAYLVMARQFIEQRGKAQRFRFALSMINQLRDVASRRSFIRNQRQVYLNQHPAYKPKKVPPGNYAKTNPNSYLRWLISSLNGKYLQQHAPFRKQTVPVGHSVRFGYLETAVAMLQRLEGDKTLLPPMEDAWDRMVKRRMYITGGIGSVADLEGFGNDYELDPEYAYAETCAALASMYWSWEMALITGKAKYSDLFEWQLYNAAGVGMGLSGEDYLYNNPLVCRGGVTRKAWYAVPCCPSNLSRTWADLGKYIYSTDRDAIWIHQYIGSKARFSAELQGEIEIESELPWKGKARISIELPTPTEFTIHLRIPFWVKSGEGFPLIRVNGEPLTQPIQMIPTFYRSAESTTEGYPPERSCFASIQRVWSTRDIIEVDFGIPIELRRAHPKVKGHKNKVAVTRGPLVYCLESLDNPGVDIFSTRLDTTSLRPETAAELLGGITVLTGLTVEGRRLLFIPYHLWANRGESQMTVWVNI